MTHREYATLTELMAGREPGHNRHAYVLTETDALIAEARKP